MRVGELRDVRMSRGRRQLGRSLVLAVMLVLGLAAPTPAAAESVEPSSSRSASSAFPLSVGISAGYSRPSGHVRRSILDGTLVPLEDGVSAAWPLELRLAYRHSSGLRFGAYLGWAFAEAGAEVEEDLNEMPVGTTAQFHVLRFGAELAYHTQSHALTNFWLSARVGSEALTVAVDAPTESVEVTYDGLELGLCAGVKWKISERFRLGPYVSWSRGTYEEANIIEVSEGEARSETDISTRPSRRRTPG